MHLSDLTYQQRRYLKPPCLCSLGHLRAYWSLLFNHPFTLQETSDLLNEVNADANPPDPSNDANIERY